MDTSAGTEGRTPADASSIPKGDVMSDNTLDIFDDHYRRLRNDSVLRQQLIDNPAEGLKEHFGAVPGDGKCRIEVIVQDPDTIVILLPTPPEADKAVEVEAASSRIYDVLFNSGVGGFFIPSMSMTWVLRDFRSKVSGKAPPSN